MTKATKESSGPELEHMIEFREGMELLKNEYPDKAVVKLRRALEQDKRNPYYISFLGVALARAEQKWDEASQLCETAIGMNRKEIQFHLNLTQVYLLAGEREKAVDSLDYASRLFGKDPRIRKAFSKVHKRRAPVFSFLDRQHFLNRKLGKLRHRLLSKPDKQ